MEIATPAGGGVNHAPPSAPRSGKRQSDQPPLMTKPKKGVATGKSGARRTCPGKDSNANGYPVGMAHATPFVCTATLAPMVITPVAGARASPVASIAPMSMCAPTTRGLPAKSVSRYSSGTKRAATSRPASPPASRRTLSSTKEQLAESGDQKYWMGETPTWQ